MDRLEPVHGLRLFHKACQRGEEGLSQRMESPYISRRSRDWSKSVSHAQEFVIAVSRTTRLAHRLRRSPGRLLCARWEDLNLCRKVGTGFGP